MKYYSTKIDNCFTYLNISQVIVMMTPASLLYVIDSRAWLAMKKTISDRALNTTSRKAISLVNGKVVVISSDKSTVKSMLHVSVRFITLYREGQLICDINRKTNTRFSCAGVLVYSLYILQMSMTMVKHLSFCFLLCFHCKRHKPAYLVYRYAINLLKLNSTCNFIKVTF